MNQLAELNIELSKSRSPLYTDGKDISLPEYESIDKQIIPGTGLFDGQFFLHGKTPDMKYIKGTLWEIPLLDKMESDMQWFKEHGAKIPEFERVSIDTESEEEHQLVVSEFIEGLEIFDVFRESNSENIAHAIAEAIKFANIHLDYLELSIEKNLPVLSDVHLRQLHFDQSGNVYMLDLEPRYSDSSTNILINESKAYKNFLEKYQGQLGLDTLEVDLFFKRCKRVEEEYGMRSQK